MARPAHEIALRAWVERVLVPTYAGSVIFEDQDAPRPELPYASVRMLTDGPASWAPRVMERYELELDDTLTQHIHNHREGTVRVQTFGRPSFDHDQALDALELSVWIETERAALETEGGVVVVGPAGPKARVGRFSSNRVEDRSALDFRYRRVACVSVADVPTVESANVDAKVVEPDGSEIIETINIPAP